LTKTFSHWQLFNTVYSEPTFLCYLCIPLQEKHKATVQTKTKPRDNLRHNLFVHICDRTNFTRIYDKVFGLFAE